MTRATLHVRFAGPLVTVQDNGRTGHLRYGVPASGPMDRLAMAAANIALGNAPGATTVEISMGGAVLECGEGPLTVAIAGGGFSVDHAGAMLAPWTVTTLRPGQKLNIRPGSWGSWAYLAVAGTIQCNQWLVSSATHSQSGFGGGALHTGARLEISDAETRDAREGDIAQPDFAVPTGRCHVTLGPQDHHFKEGATDLFFACPYTLTDAYDRMGVRLDGPALPLDEALSIPSEPIVRGSVQVSGDGVPTVLLADHQTTGGYPKIATVVSCDLNAVAQMRSRDTLRFVQVTPRQAIDMARDYAAKVKTYLSDISAARGNLMQRLMSENLISGVVYDDPKRSDV